MRRAGSPNYSGGVLQKQFAESARGCGCKVFRIPDSTFVIKGGTASRKSPADHFVFAFKDRVAHVVLAE